MVNGSQTHTIKGLKPGTSFRVRVVAKDHSEQVASSTRELRVSVPGEGLAPGVLCARRAFPTANMHAGIHSTCLAVPGIPAGMPVLSPEFGQPQVGIPSPGPTPRLLSWAPPAEVWL